MARKFVLVRAHLQDILLLFMFIITEDIKKNGAKVTEELRIVLWRPVNSNYGAAKIPGLGHCPSPSSNIFRQNNICMRAVVSS
jgi:hypothetical protein